jgi:hypothetical protein
MEEAVDRRLQYGTVLTLAEWRKLYNATTGVCRGCRTEFPDTPVITKAAPCPVCERPRIFGAVHYVWNGWIKELPPGNQKWRNIPRLLEERKDVGASQ